MRNRIFKLSLILLTLMVLAFAGFNAYRYKILEENYMLAQDYFSEDTIEGYKRALELLEGLKEYKNSGAIIDEIKEALYEGAQLDILNNESYSISDADKIIAAMKRLELIPGYKNSNGMIRTYKNYLYEGALYYLNNNNYFEAIKLFKQLTDYRRSNEMILDLEDSVYNEGLEDYKNNRIDAAIEKLSIVNYYKDSESLLEEIAVLDEKYNKGIELANSGDLKKALEAAIALTGFRDSSYIGNYLKARSIYINDGLSIVERQQGIYENIYYLAPQDFELDGIRSEFQLFKESIKDIEGSYILTKLKEVEERITASNIDSVIHEIYKNYGISIMYKSQDIIEVTPYYEVTLLENNEDVYRLIEIIRGGLKKYPVGMIRGNINAIYLAEKVYLKNPSSAEKKRVAGLAGEATKTVYLGFIKNDFKFAHTFHHEFAHILFYSDHESIFPTEIWTSLNKGDGYMEDTFDIIDNPQYASGREYSYMKRGFISSYAATTLKEDMAELSAGIFTSGMNLFDDIEDYPILFEKYKLLLAFYKSMDSVISDELLRAISKL